MSRLVPKLRFKEFSGEWEEKKLKNLTLKISDGIHRTPNYQENGTYYFINGNNLVNGIISINNITKRVTKEEYEKHKRDLNKNTILLSINGTIGNIAIYKDEKVVLGKSVCYINIKDDIVNKFFIINSLKTENIQSFFTTELTGSTIKNLSLKTIKNTLIYLPTPQEQQKIADTLSSLDNLIEANNKKIEALKEHKKGLMQQLFPTDDEKMPKLRFKEFIDNEKLRINNEEWEEKRFGDICEIIMGQSPSSSSYNSDSNGIYLIQGNADIKERKTYPRIWTTESKKECKINDIILTVRAPVGYVAKSLHNACIGRGVCAIRNKKNYYLDFVYYFLLNFEKQWENLGQGSTFTAIGTNDIKNLKILIPKSYEEQQKIANTLSSLDNLIEAQSKKIEALKQHKKGLMQQMFVSEKVCD